MVWTRSRAQPAGPWASLFHQHRALERRAGQGRLLQEPRALRASSGVLPGPPGAPGWFDAWDKQEGVERPAGGRQDTVRRGQAGGVASRQRE